MYVLHTSVLTCFYEILNGTAYLVTVCTYVDSNLNLTSKEKKQLSHMLSSMHLSLLDQPAQLPGVNNWTYRYFVERYIHMYIYIFIVCTSVHNVHNVHKQLVSL